MYYLEALVPELWLRIHRSTEHSDLKNLSLTCKLFHSLVQPLIFETLRVVIPNNPAGSRKDIETFLKSFVAHFSDMANSATVAPLVKTAAFADRLAQGNQEAMDLFRAYKEQIPQILFGEMLPKFQNIQSLTLYDAGVDYDAPTRQAVDALPNLRNLHLFHVWIEAKGKTLPLESFTFSNESMAFGQKFGIVDHTTVREMILHPGEYGLDGLFLALRGQTLTLLTTLELVVCRRLPEAEAVAFLAQCPNIESLTLERTGTSGIAMVGQMAGPLNALMNNLLAPQQRELTLVLPEGSLPRLRKLRCPYGYALSILPGRTTIEELSLQRSRVENPHLSLNGPIAAARGSAGVLKKLFLLSTLPHSEYPAVLAAIAESLPNVENLLVFPRESAPNGVLAEGVAEWVLPPSVKTLDFYDMPDKDSKPEDVDASKLEGVVLALAGMQQSGALSRVQYEHCRISAFQRKKSREWVKV
ncbi:hypothetical protein MKEN_01317100 [Mycena kentingensis (nom. inval.)]|nr:hypothetical protein MKEN_01317100 [Mycena kentingensis (nom. inval.)]